MTARPSSFEPLASSDPVPGDPYQVAALGKRLSDTADEISTQVANLRKLAEHSTEFWTGKAASKFHDSASDLATRIDKAHGRYATTGQVLSGWSKSIDDAQTDAYPAVLDAQQAQADLQSTAPLPAAPAGSPPPTADEQAAARRRAGDHSDAQTRLNNARSRFEAAVDVYNTKAKQAQGAIDEASDHDGLKDSWWQRNFHWIDTVLKVIAIVIIVLAIVAVLIVCPFSAGLFVAIGISAEAIETATVIAVGALTVLDAISAEQGTGSWTAVGLDLLSLCTFGFGKLAEAGVGALAKYGEGIGKAVTSARAGRAFASAEGMPKVLYSLATHSDLARTLLGFSSKFARVLSGADEAASAAADSLGTAVKAIKKGSTLVSAFTLSADVSEDIAKISKVDELVPGVLRVAATKSAATIVAATDGVAQTTTFAVTTAYAGVNDVKDWIEDHQIEHQLDQIVDRFSNPLVHVP